jgi:peptidoglycan/LPS O-acetylase OafA/YrhL
VPAEIVTAAAVPDRQATPAPAGRMGWLDGLRAVAVLLVVYAHLSRYLFRGAREVSAEWLHAGTAGVMLFFLVSGYIIPASLERHGDLRQFWVSRFGRLLPLYLVVGVAVVLLVGYRPAEPVTAAVAHATMLPFLLDVPLVTPVIWTLTFEMVFYLLVTALFAVGRQRAAGLVAAGLAVAAVLAAPLPARTFPAATGAVAVLLLAGLLAVSSRRRWAVVGGGLLLGGVALVLLTLNQDPSHAWDGLLIVAVMCTGTVIYRADRGETGWWPVALVGTLVAAALLHNWWAELASLDALTPRYVTRSVLTLLVFAGAFAAGMLTRRRRTPRWLARVGLLSYSVYLVHYVLIQLLAPHLTRLGERLPAVAEIPAVAGYLALVLGVSWLTHRWIEVPGQRLARVGCAGRRWWRASGTRSRGASPARTS